MFVDLTAVSIRRWDVRGSHCCVHQKVGCSWISLLCPSEGGMFVDLTAEAIRRWDVRGSHC